MDRLQLSERDICTKFITPAIQQAGWQQHQFREEVNITQGRVMVRGKLAARIKNPEAKGGPKRADYVLYARPNLPIAVVEAKPAKFSIGHGMQQALGYAEMLDAPFALSSNGEGFLLHDRTGLTQPVERGLQLDAFPTLDELWSIYQQWQGFVEPEALKLIEQPFHTDGSGKEPRYYQRVAINRAVEAIAKGQQRVLLVMATGTGKTYTAFQIIWRLWKAKARKRILFLADRNILVDQTMQQDFAPFGEVMHKVSNREVRKNYEIYLALYQAVTGKEEWKQIYRQFPVDFFDLVVVDECHRGSAADDSAWREVLDYFGGATHLGLTATPKETKEISNITYFGEPVYTYSLKQGIEDGFLAPYKVIRIATDVDAVGYTPEKGKLDKLGQVVEQRQYNTKDFDRSLVLEKRTRFVAGKVWEYLKATDPMNAAQTSGGAGEGREPWNGEFYVSFGDPRSRSWEDARRYGFISGGGGAWYSQTLKLLQPGDRVWVKIPGTGYVGVGRVQESVQPVSTFTVSTPEGEKPAMDVLQHGDHYRENADNPDLAEYFVRVNWLDARDARNAVNEVGLFGNQNTVCKPTTPKWRHTVERLKTKLLNWDAQ